MTYQRVTEPARRAAMANAANRAVDDPKALARAARIVRAALARGVLSPADIIGTERNGSGTAVDRA